MTFTVVIIVLATLLVGAGIGYYLRVVISLGKKGSMELELKEMLVGAKQESQRILDERTKKPFQTGDELRRVSGIGPKTLEKLRPYITVGDKKLLLLTSQGPATSGYNEGK